MASYPAGTIFESAQSFPRYSEFGEGCVFASGSTFENPCYFGEGCVFSPGCSLLRSSTQRPPHETQNGCIFGEGCNIDYTKIGTANVIGEPGTYSPVSEGADTVVGPGNNRNLSCSKHTTIPYANGQILTDCQVSENWEEASNPAGFYGSDHLTIKDKEWDINNG